MYNPWPDNPTDILYFFTSLITLFSNLAKRIRVFLRLQHDTKTSTGNRFLFTTRNIFLSFLGLIVIGILTLVYFLVFPTHGKESSDPASIVNPTTVDNAPITSWPIKRSAKDSWLDELDPILDEEGAFFIGKWDVFDKIKVEDTIYPHSVGICIPLEYQWKYINLHNPEQIPHNEIIEYTLGYEYKTFQFDYGIDDSSFPDGIKKAPRCEFRIIVQACNSKDYVQSKDEPLFDTGWRNYRCCAHRSTEMDVSGCEAMRITVRWRFNVQQNGPIAFQIAIFNPILRAAKYKDNPTQSPIPLE